MIEADVVIVGAGIAGAATAWSLARRGVRRVLILEREEGGDHHATGRNAAILRSAIRDPALHYLARESLGFLRDPPRGFADSALLRSCGLYLGASVEHAGELLSWTSRPEHAVGAQVVDASELRRRVPHLGPLLAAAVGFEHEGTLDVHALHQGFLRGALAAGHTLRTRARAEELLLDGARVRGVSTSRGSIASQRIVLAGGAWAGELAARAGLPLPLQPRRRHLAKTVALPQVDPDGPAVWLYGPEFYARPESGGLLLCACEETDLAADQAEHSDPDTLLLLAERVAQWMPELVDARIESWWAGARTFAADRRFVIGPDPRLAGLYWVAGLGGHGITTAPAVGALAAEWIASGGTRHPWAEALAPGRLLTGSPSAERPVRSASRAPPSAPGAPP